HLLSPAGNPAEVPDRPSADLEAGRGDSFDPRLYGLERNSYGIWEPPADYEPFDAGSGEWTIVIVPGLAFDRRGCRLGRGRGYYDRWLAGIQDLDAADTFSPIGIGYSIQLVPEVPRDRHDVPLPLLIAGTAVIRRPDAG
ncbi:MAG: 5-formyltetrahydrofolate cyclo-ligase, partial [Sediminispirochaetaceae bacterium]